MQYSKNGTVRKSVCSVQHAKAHLKRVKKACRTMKERYEARLAKLEKDSSNAKTMAFRIVVQSNKLKGEIERLKQEKAALEARLAAASAFDVNDEHEVVDPKQKSVRVLNALRMALTTEIETTLRAVDEKVNESISSAIDVIKSK